MKKLLTAITISLCALSLCAQEKSAVASDAPKPITLSLSGGVKMTLMPIPAGTFIMGSPKDEEGRDDDEDQVRVTITKPFYLGMTPVTEAQYSAVMDDDPPSDNGANCPVTKVSWKKAMEFCEILTAAAHKADMLKGWKFTLPTEAQWEYACRAGTTTRFYSGDKIRDAKRVAKEAILSWDLSVAQKEPNAWGLYDMHGNVAEWCLDTYCKKLPGGEDPVVLSEDAGRVARGASSFISDFPKDYRSAKRSFLGWRKDDNRESNEVGFRVALVQE